MPTHLRRSVRAALALLAWVSLPVRDLAFSEEANDPGHFIFRMAQTERASASCLLVGPDGQFHLEQQTKRHDEVFEGTLRSDKLSELQKLLNSDSFQKLLPDAVESSLQPTGFEELMISVPRQGRWLNLRYLAGMIPDRHRAVISQFQKWEAGVLKSPHRKLNEASGRSNCLPAERIELKPRGSPQTDEALTFSILASSNLIYFRYS